MQADTNAGLRRYTRSAARCDGGGTGIFGMPALARLRTTTTKATHARHKSTDANDATAQAADPSFQAYPSLLPSRDAATVAARLLEVVADAGLVGKIDTNAALATPKLHGSNVQLFYSRDGVLKYGRRGAFLDASDDHYGARAAGADLELDVKMPELFARLAAANEGLAAVAVFGEVYGGSYPHPSVPAVKPARKPVQKRVWYATRIRIAGFDVRLDFADGRRHFLPFDDAKAACDAEGIPFVPVAKRGTLAEVCQWAVDHAADDALAHYNPEGLPLMAPGKNTGEGFVVRFAQEVACGSDRAVAKIKSPAFAEITEAPPKRDPAAAAAALDPAEQLARDIAAKYMNVNRAAAVASRLPERQVRVENMRALAEALAADARADPTIQPDELAAVADGKGARAFNTKAIHVMREFLTGK